MPAQLSTTTTTTTPPLSSRYYGRRSNVHRIYRLYTSHARLCLCAVLVLCCELCCELLQVCALQSCFCGASGHIAQLRAQQRVMHPPLCR